MDLSKSGQPLLRTPQRPAVLLRIKSKFLPACVDLPGPGCLRDSPPPYSTSPTYAGHLIVSTSMLLTRGLHLMPLVPGMFSLQVTHGPCPHTSAHSSPNWRGGTHSAATAALFLADLSPGSSLCPWLCPQLLAKWHLCDE